MKVLLIDREAHYYAGAERMLEYFVAGAREVLDLVVVVSAGARAVQGVPSGVVTVELTGGSQFRPGTLLRHGFELARLCRTSKVEAIHAWVARDWELAALVSLLTGIPATGTLHDHPQAGFIGVGRQKLMRFCCNRLLRGVAVVSRAVGDACQQAGYRVGKLRVIHNGLPYQLRPPGDNLRYREVGSPVSFGFLGVLSERKGLRLLFETLEQLSTLSSHWRLLIAGEAQDEHSKRLKAELASRYAGGEWWSRVEWLGWLTETTDFWREIDALLLPSTGFDPFPTVVLEAAYHRVPVVSTDCGGMPEMIRNGETGWVIPKDEWPEAAACRLASLADHPEFLVGTGLAASEHCAHSFSMAQMIQAYQGLFSGMGAGTAV
jgi:glycosyltransferase involved in cell wall biosynthesis